MPTTATAGTATKFDTTRTGELFAERISAQADLAAAEAAGSTGRVAARRAARRIEEATNAIVRENYGLVIRYVKTFTRSELSRHHAEDYEQAAVLGMLGAIDTYQPGKGSFAQWAWKRIQREVLSTVAGTEFSTITSNDFEQRPRILKARKALIDAGVEQPTAEQIAEIAGTTIPLTKRVLEAPRLESVDATIGSSDDGHTLGDTIVDESADVADQVLSSMTLTSLERNGLHLLNARELFVITRRFGLDGEPAAKLVRIGSLLGISREAARQIEAKALAKLNHPALLGEIIEHVR